MTIQTLQKEVDAWISTTGVRYFSELTNMAVLTEEVGELARLISRIYGEQSFKTVHSPEEAKAKMADELCDIIWVVTCLANQTGIDLTNAMENNFKKKKKRDNTRHKNNPKLQ